MTTTVPPIPLPTRAVPAVSKAPDRVLVTPAPGHAGDGVRLADGGPDGRPPRRHRLLRAHSVPAPMTPTDQQREVIEHRDGRLRVLAGPGTGKTATIVEAVVNRIVQRGMDPASVLVLTFSRRAAAELSHRISARLAVTLSEPLVRTLHSYAYAVVRAAAAEAGEPPPRLLDAGQADLMVREMLAGHADDGAAGWPPHLLAALRVPAFAAELREFMLRTVQQQIPPREIAAAARRMRRPEWLAAARFIDEYRDIADLRQATSRFGAALDQAELTTAALERLARPAVLSAQQARFRRIFVDEYQDVDPAQASLVESLASGADELVVAGDPDQSIYAFRGAAAGALQRVPVDSTVALTTSYRMPAELIAATRRVASRLPGPVAHRALTPAATTVGGTGAASGGPRAGSMDVRVLPSSASEAAFLADELRRAHLEDGIAWSRMAVVLRAPTRSAEPLRRACGAAGVPVAAGQATPLPANPLVAAMFAVLRAGVEPESLTAEQALALLSSPLAGMDPLAVRRLRRALRADGGGPPDAERADDVRGPRTGGSSADRLAQVLLGRRRLPGGMPGDVVAPVRRLQDLIRLAGADEQAAEDVLWQLWQRSGLAERLVAASERGGRDGAVADVLLDAAVALFDRAAQLAEQLPGAGVRGLLELVGDELIPSQPTADRRTDAVTILSAHAAKGLEFDVVCVASVQQDTWPDVRRRTSLLDLPALLDAAAGIDSGTPAASALADERRLFYVAVTRARRRLVVTAVQDEQDAPSQFLTELLGAGRGPAEGGRGDGHDGGLVPVGWPRDRRGRARRALNLPALVAELRRAVTAPAGDGGGADAPEVEHAARALARLAAAGVPGADPDEWHGLAAVSTDAPLVAPGQEVVLSPSQVESMLGCPLRAVLERHGARGAPGQAQLLGIAVHALAQGMAAGATDADLAAATEEFLAAQDRLPPWEVARLRRMVEAMTTALREWMRTEGAEREFVGSELPLRVPLPPLDGVIDVEGAPTAGARTVRLVGRADWVSRDPAGRLVVTDFKSGASPPTRAAVAEHAQLAVYQLAAALGAFSDLDAVNSGPGGGAPAESPADALRSGGPAEGEAADSPADTARPDGPADGIPGATRPWPELGGAELVYLRSGRAKTLAQRPQSAPDRAAWITRLHEVADAVSGASLTARRSEACERCPVRSSCPLQPEGRQVTR